MLSRIALIFALPCSNLIALGLPTGPRMGHFLGNNEVRQSQSRNLVAAPAHDSQPSLPTWEVFLCAYEIGSAAGLYGYHTDIAFCPVGTPTSSLPSKAEAPEFLWTNRCIEMIWDGRHDGAIYQSVDNDVGKWPQGVEQPLQPELTYRGRASVDLRSLAQYMQTCGTWGGDNWRDFNQNAYHFTKHNCNKFSHQVLKYLNFGGLDLKYGKETLLDYAILYWVGRAGLYLSATAEARENIKRVVDAPIQPSARCQHVLEQDRTHSPERGTGLWCCGF